MYVYMYVYIAMQRAIKKNLCHYGTHITQKGSCLDLCSYGMLRRVRWYFVTDVSERRFGPYSIPRSAKIQRAQILQSFFLFLYFEYLVNPLALELYIYSSAHRLRKM